MSNNSKIEKSRRLVHLDLLRIFAIYLVIFNHTSNRGFTLFASEMDSIWYFPHMFFSVFCKIAVPIFFMISGALLLNRQESYKKLFLKRILRMVVVLLVISVPFYIWLHRDQGLDIFSFFTYIYGNSASTSLWYIYSYISLLMLLPFLRSMVKNMQSKDYIYLIIGHVVLSGILPCLEYLIWKGETTIHESFSPVIFVSQNIFFALIGYYLENVLEKKHFCKKKALVSIFLCFIAIFITCFMTHYKITLEGAQATLQLEWFFNCFIAIPAITVFFLAKGLSSKMEGDKLSKILSVLGSSVFGVYLIEKFARSLTVSLYSFLLPYVGSFISSLTWCLCSCCLCFLIVVPLKNIPGIKKIVNKFI